MQSIKDYKLELQGIVDDALEANEYMNEETFNDVLKDVLNASPNVQKEYTRVLMHEGIRSIINQRKGVSRKEVKTSDVSTNEPPGEAFQTPIPIRPGVEGKKTAVLYKSILTMWKVGNKNLGECTREDIVKQSETDQKRADGNLRNVAFYGKLLDHKKFTNTSTVGDLGATMVEQIKQSIWEQTEAA